MSMGHGQVHTEATMEREVCGLLAQAGWLHAAGDAARYDRATALFPDDLGEWVRASQPQAWAALKKSHGARAQSVLAERVRKALDAQGALDVLRQGVAVVGLRAPISMVQFKPAFRLNEDLAARYALNRLRVVQQVKYSQANENCIDLVLFVNGIPTATIELKTDFTQSVEDAVIQYKTDRLPKPKGQAVEPLLQFGGGALVHFAVSTSEVMMTTKLDGWATRFLPFNRGCGGGKGNPPNPRGYQTAYLWDEVLQRDSWLEILGRYLFAVRDSKQQVESVVFPRYHQLDATRRLQAAVRRDGPGGRYLIQHSAGSGKTNSIAWTAHFLSELHDEAERKLFDSVLVVSDRNVIDKQLQAALFQATRTAGVVESVTNETGSKSQKLAEALSGGKKIVVCTMQTFPKALEAVRELSATNGKRYAVVADEAHSSQAGEAASTLKSLLSAEEWQAVEDGGEISNEDLLAAAMESRAQDSRITFVAFTATPKAKTMELFGTRPDPARKPAPDNVPQPFHVYSMRQAIEEGFILDVLRNYTSYKTAYQLAHKGESSLDHTEVERSAALKKLVGWVRLHPHNIAQKVQVVVEHFRSVVAPLLGGRAKAMVVVGSRLEAVRWQLAIRKYISEKGYVFGTLVAYSGEVNDPESGPDPLTEASEFLNPGLRSRDIRDAFAEPQYQILLVANKFQTGFDQKLLCGMYVDKKLAGIQAVQTLSRLNRAAEGKDRTYVLDFVNDPDEVLESFRMYYETAELETTTDPDVVLTLMAKLDASGHYDENEVERVVAAELRARPTQGELVAALQPVVERLAKRHLAACQARRAAEARGDAKAAQAAQDEIDALLLFQGDMAAYVRMYHYLSQIYDYGQTAVEKRAMFYKQVLRLLDFERERSSIDLSQVVLTHHSVKERGTRDLALTGGGAKLDPMSAAGTGIVREKESAYLSEIIARLNELFTDDVTDGDQLSYAQTIHAKLGESPVLQEQAENNSRDQFYASPDLMAVFNDAVIESMDAHNAMSKQVLDDERVKIGLLHLMMHQMGLYESLRARRRA
jgi:type I restriction enzyme R subunit